jgi:hypothetical protein
METKHTDIERQRHELTASTAMMRVASDDARHPEAAAALADVRGRLYASLPALADRFALSPSSVQPQVIVRDTSGELDGLHVSLIDAPHFVHAVNFIVGLSWHDRRAGGRLQMHDHPSLGLAWLCPITGRRLDTSVDAIAGTRMAIEWLGIKTTVA